MHKWTILIHLTITVASFLLFKNQNALKCATMSISDNKGENGFSTTRILLKFFPVVSMLAQSPNDHLIGTGQGEQPSYK